MLGEPVTTPLDPTTLVGEEVESFTLQMSATGTVQAVDASPVEAIAEQRLQASIQDGYVLVEDSTSVTVGEGSVEGGTIVFQVEVSAKQVRPLDAAELEAMVLGLPEAEAEEVLAEYGEVVIVLWPDWAGSVPSLDQRVTLTVTEPVDPAAGESPAPSADRASRDARAEPRGRCLERAGTIRLMHRPDAARILGDPTWVRSGSGSRSRTRPSVSPAPSRPSTAAPRSTTTSRRSSGSAASSR